MVTNTNVLNVDSTNVLYCTVLMASRGEMSLIRKYFVKFYGILLGLTAKWLGYVKKIQKHYRTCVIL